MDSVYFHKALFKGLSTCAVWSQNLHLYEVIEIIKKRCQRHPQQQISQTGNDLGEK